MISSSICLSLLWFISLSIMSSRFIYFVTNGRNSFLLMAEKYSSVCVCVCLCERERETDSIFIHSPTGWNWGCFYILATMKNAARNMGMQGSLEKLISSPLNKNPEVGLLDNMLALFLMFWATSILFSIVAATIHSPTGSTWGFPFLHILNIYLLSFWEPLF